MVDWGRPNGAGTRNLPCPRCAKHVPVDLLTGAILPHAGQVTGKKQRIRENPCRMSEVVVSKPVPGGLIMLARDQIEENLRVREGRPPIPKKRSKGVGESRSSSVRTVSGGLPGLGRRR